MRAARSGPGLDPGTHLEAEQPVALLEQVGVGVAQGLLELPHFIGPLAILPTHPIEGLRIIADPLQAGQQVLPLGLKVSCG